MTYIAARAGYDFVSYRLIAMHLPNEPNYDPVLNGLMLRQTRTALAQTGLKVHDVELPRIQDGVDVKSYVPALETAAELGATDVITSIWTAQRNYAIDCLGELCDLGAKLGLFMNLEFVTWANVSNLAEAVAVCRSVRRDNCALLIDVLHFSRSRVGLKELDAVPRAWLRFAHVSDAPAVMTSELMHSFGIGAKDLGSLSAFYFYAYVAMQIPTGILVDSWGARKLLIAGSISAAAGTFLFGATGDFAMACAGRAIVGGSTAVGWLVLLKLATHWFPARRFAMLSSPGLFFGNIGALTAQVPLRLMIKHFGWRAVVLGSGAVVFGVCLLAWAIVRNDPEDRQCRSYAPPASQRKDGSTLGALAAGFRRVFAYRNTC